MPNYYFVVLHWDSHPGNTASGSSILCGTSSLVNAGLGHLSAAIVQYGAAEAPTPVEPIETALSNVIHENALGTFNHGGLQIFLNSSQKNINIANSIAQTFYMSFFSAESILGGTGRVLPKLQADINDLERPPSDVKYQQISENAYHTLKVRIREIYRNPGNWSFSRNCSTLVKECAQLTQNAELLQGQPRDRLIRDPSYCEWVTSCFDTPNSVFERCQGDIIPLTGHENRVTPSL